MIRILIYLGSALMVYNIYGFIRFARYVRRLRAWNAGTAILRFPIVLLVLFLMGYLTVGVLGQPDLVMAGILFGGSIFVFVMYRLLSGVTQRIVESEQLEAQLMATEEATRAKTGFLASISHEMRTPMNVIIGLNNAALNEPDLPPDCRGKLQRLGQSADQLLRLINNILEMNNIETDSLALRSETFRLSGALEQVNGIVRTLCEQKGLDFVVNIEENADGRYLGDVTHLKKVLLSILDNAVKFTDPPGTVRLDAACTQESGTARTLRFTVTDTGVGIDPAFLPRMFRMFEREDASSTTRFGGTGLSLALSKHIVEKMGGDIAVQSVKGEGSVFTVTLPLERAAEEAGAETPEEVSLAGRRVLIVEDTPENAEIVADLLELEHVESEHAENGQIGLCMFSDAPPGYYDAILMDLRMPVMDGLEATRRIRALERPDAKTIPIIAVTANAFESDVRQTFAAGMDAHLAKPADSDLLYGTLKHMIARQSGKEGVSA